MRVGIVVDGRQGAGRASYLTLWPMTRREQRGLGQCGHREELFITPDARWHELLADENGSPEDVGSCRRAASATVKARQAASSST